MSTGLGRLVIKPIFNKGSSIAPRAAILALLALTLIVLNAFTSLLDEPREQLNRVVAPLYGLVGIPSRLVDWGSDSLKSRGQLEQENEAMKAQLLVQQGKLQQLASIAADNVRLRELLNSAEMVRDRVLVAELIGVSPDPMSHLVIVNRGTDDGVYIGQPLLDAQGLMGQVVDVSADSAQVLLITDSTHALPVQVNRNGVRAIAEGTGSLYALKLRHLAVTVDINEGDLLVSSGLGGRFPEGYPVATVKSVIRHPGKPFAEVYAVPKALMNRSRHVLLVFSGLSESDFSRQGQ